MARREREFGQLRQSFMTPKPVPQPNTPHRKLETASNYSQVQSKAPSQQGSTNSRRNREFQQQAVDSRIKRSEYIPQPQINTPESPSKKLQDVCVSCVNKFMANKHKMKELEKKEVERVQEKKKLEAEREAILEEQMEHIRRVREEQQEFLRLQADKVKAKEAENRLKVAEAAKLNLEKRIAEQEEKQMFKAQNEKKGKFYHELASQIEENKMRKTQQIKKQKEGTSTLFNQQEANEAQQKRTNEYRNDLLEQIRQKQVKEKQQKLRSLQQQKNRIEQLQATQYEPNIRVTSPNPYNEIKKQIDQRDKLRKTQQMQSKARDEEQSRNLREQENEISKTIIEQRMKEMSKYVTELAQQVQEKHQRDEKEQNQRRAPGFTPIEEHHVDYKNCTNCDLKFPTNYLSTVEL